MRVPLVVRIYALGVLLAVLVVGSFLVVAIARPSPRMVPRDASMTVDIITADVASAEQLDRRLATLHATYGFEATVRDERGVVVAHAGAPPEKYGFDIVIPHGMFRGGSVHVRPRPPKPPTRDLLISASIILAVLAIGTVLIARSYGGRLSRIARAARAFGRGDLGTRVGIERTDELGEVAHAFDEMASSIETLRRADRELLTDISHELRTPLSRIAAALDVAGNDPTLAQAMLREITQDLLELQQLVEDVLTAARLDLDEGEQGATSTPLRRTEIRVRELVEQALTRFRAVHGELEIEPDIDDDLPALDGDPMMLRRVLDNVLENARKYGKPGDPIRLRARLQEHLVVLEVEDHGIGISREDLERVFRPFFRADSSRTRATGGLGLGLALCRRIVEAHGGTIAIQSEPGSGTLVRVALPAA